MQKFAVIDIGSNSVRLMLVADGKTLYKTLQTTRLGEGLAAAPVLLPQAIERTAQAVAALRERALADGAEKVYVFATAAVRSAENREIFLSRVRALCGLSVEVISGEKEAEIGILGALGEADGALIDVGGASTEIVVKAGGALIYKKSADIGVVRLKDACGRDKDKLISAARAAAKTYGAVRLPKTLYAIGGTATTLAALFLGLQMYDSARVTGTEITQAQLARLADRLSAMSVEEIAALPCMPKGRADVLSGGAVLLSTLTEIFGVEKLIVSDRDNLEGYAVWNGLMR